MVTLLIPAVLVIIGSIEFAMIDQSFRFIKWIFVEVHSSGLINKFSFEVLMWVLYDFHSLSLLYVIIEVLFSNLPSIVSVVISSLKSLT